MRNNIQGTGVALVTPFTKTKEIDFDALGNLIDHVIRGGADYLVALGTTAETPTLSGGEKVEVAEFVKKHNAGRLPLIVGIGGNNTSEVIAQMDRFDMNGITAILSVTPYYNKPNQAGLFEHYKAVAKESPRPVILYNVPGRTGVNMTARTTLKLAHEVENIVAVKEASGCLSQISYILRDKPERFMVISGDDNMALPVVALGGDGVISVTANAFPEIYCRMVQLCLAGDFAGASLLQLEALECVECLFTEGNPVGIKAALSAIGLIRNEVRLPLVPASAELAAKIAAQIEKYALK